MTPRSVQGETVRLLPPVEPAFLLTDRPMRWSGVNTACASRQGTRFVSRPTMVAARGPVATEIGSAAAGCPYPGGSRGIVPAARVPRSGHGQPPPRSGVVQRAAQALHLLVVDALNEPPHRHVLVAAGAQDLRHQPGVVILARFHRPV